MAFIAKLLWKIEVFQWIPDYQQEWEAIKQPYVDALILIAPRWDLEFHVYIDTFNSIISIMLVQNPIGKCDQLIVYTSQLLNNAKRNYTTTKRETLMMVYTLHKYHHYLLNNKFVFYVDHMALLYLVKKPQVFGLITQWFLLFLKYNFSMVYKLEKSHSILNVLSYLPTSNEPNGVPDQVVDAPLFLLQLVLL